jgi:hypothetical protein
VTPEPLPLAGARKRPGRPPKVAGAPRPARPSPPDGGAVSACLPRLLGVRATAAYLDVSPRTVMELRAAGHLRPVRLPLTGDHEVRKLLFDRVDLDRLIEAWKDPA